MYIHTYVNMYICIYAYMHICLVTACAAHGRMWWRISVCVHTPLFLYIHMYGHSTSTSIYTYMYRCCLCQKQSYVMAYICVNTRTRKSMFIYINTFSAPAAPWVEDLNACVRFICNHITVRVFVYVRIHTYIVNIYSYIFVCVYIYIHIQFSSVQVPPSKKLHGSGISTPYTLFCLTCTINSELKYFLIFFNLSEPGLISAGLQWTG